MDSIAAIAPPRGLLDIQAFEARRSENAYKSFEAMFLQVMLKEMRRTVPRDGGLFPKSPATETFEEMLDAALAQSMADSGQMGIARQLAAEAARLEAAAAQAVERNLAKNGLEPLKAGPAGADNP